MGTKNFSVCVLSVVTIFVTFFHNSQCSLDVSKPPVDELKPYLTVKPIIHDRRHKRSIALGEYPNHLKISIPIDNRELSLDLKLNNQLIPKGYFRKIQKNGFNKIDRFSSENLKFCHYMGKVGNRTNSWVALSTCDGLSGAIYDGNQMYYIEKKKSGEKNEHFLYKSTDFVGQNATCGFLNKKEEIRKKRSTISKNKIFAPYTANRTSKYVELVLVIDNQKYLEMDQNVEAIEDYSKNVVNIMNALYAPLNVYIALTGVVIWTEKDEIQISQDRVQTLRNFLRFRQDKLNPEHPNDNAQLITKTKFETGTLGSALYRTICTDMYSGSVSTDFSSVVATTATTLAHMLGHNFGMPHDGAECECPDSRCIMNVNIAPEPPTHWSSCSRDALDSAFSHGLDHCLKNPPSKLFKGPICGNGFLEEGEECDCGLPDHCKNKCCNAKTCKLEENAQCGTGSCCDLKTCRLRKNGTVCRQTCDFCDLPEYCTGETEFCPSDVFKLDGEVCEDGFCYKGRCGSHSDQCKVLWGPLAQKSHEKCYKLNVKGSKFGHCGYDQRTHTYKKCNVEDVECGLLHCGNVFEDLQYGLDSVSIFSQSYIQHNGTILTCRNAIIDLGSESTDPGQVPNGAKCGDGKMCVNQKCVSIVSVQEGRKCPDDCNNNGYCNDQGLCHCKQGFLLPDCKHPVSGESSHLK